MPAPKSIALDDLYRFQLPTACDLSPDGAWIVYALSRVEKKTEKKYSNLWRVDVPGGEPRPFTCGDQYDGAPVFSPDGRWIAFLSNRKDEQQAQIYVIPTDGGEARMLTDMPGRYADLAWSPDSRRIAFSFRKKDADAVERDKDEDKKKLGIVARHVTRMFYKADGEGFLPRERWHLWTVGVPSGKTRQLTEGAGHDEDQPGWSPDSRSLVFVSNRAEDPDLDPEAMDLWIIPARGGEMKKLTTPKGEKSHPAFSPDGERVAWFGRRAGGGWGRPAHVWVAPVESGRAVDLLANHDLHASSFTIGDLVSVPQMPPRWSTDGARITFQALEQGRTTLRWVATSGRTPELGTVVAAPGVVGAWNFDRTRQRIACVFGTLDDPAQVCVVEDGVPRPLTRINRDRLDKLSLGTVEEVWLKKAGENGLQGWILLPPGFRKNRRYPCIVEVHGGPHTQYGYTFMHEFRALAARGFVVAFCNPRGSHGYGAAHATAIDNAWGTVDYQDVMAFADHVSKRPFVDTKRMGITGGSYGGYMTNWVIGHTRRFAAAVTQRCVSNLISMYGSSDINWLMGMELGHVPPWTHTEHYWQRSPMSSIHKAKTPTLVIHSEQDHRCPIEQGEQVFVALKKLGVPTEMVRFPDESHGLSRGGRTDRRVERLTHMVRWFEKYLGK